MFKELVDAIMIFLAQPKIQILGMMIAFGLVGNIIKYIKEEDYANALIEIVIAAIFSWPIAILIAIYIGYKFAKEKKASQQQEQPEPMQKHEPQPGSAEHYELWKAEREGRSE